MLTMLVSQTESDRLFRVWADAMISGSTPHKNGWMIEGAGIVFSNYGNGAPGEIDDQAMIGVDPTLRSGTVKIVKPNTSTGDKGKVTVIGKDKNNNVFLLREGRLQKNLQSRRIKDDFALLSDLKPVPVYVSSKISERQWYIVADLQAPPNKIVEKTVEFALACAKARSRAGDGDQELEKASLYELGADEKGHVFQVERKGSSAAVCALQGYVYEALKLELGIDLQKPKNTDYSVDGFIDLAGILIEIKTSVYAHSIYEAVGQLTLYPFLIGLPEDLELILLVPDSPIMKPSIAAALNKQKIQVYTYTVKSGKNKPNIIFSHNFLERCKRGTREN